MGTFIDRLYQRLASEVGVRFFHDEYFLWRLTVLREHYKLYSRTAGRRMVIVHMTESTQKNGLADRLKGMVSAYIAACENGYDFKIYHTAGFNLEDYLSPNEIDWRIDKESISYGLNEVRLIWDLHKLPVFRKGIRQYHAYGLTDVLPCLDEKLQAKYKWSTVFAKLFRPSEKLEHLLNKITDRGGYISIHIRFLNYLENVESDSPEICTTTGEEKAAMIRSCMKTIERIHRGHPGKRIIIFSDSNRFLREPMPECARALKGEVGHVGHKHSGAVFDKAFVDLFVMARSEHVYSIVGPGLYKSGFACYGAKIGDVPYHCIDREM